LGFGLPVPSGLEGCRGVSPTGGGCGPCGRRAGRRRDATPTPADSSRVRREGNRTPPARLRNTFGRFRGRSRVRREGNRTPPARLRNTFGRFASSSPAPARRTRERRRGKTARGGRNQDPVTSTHLPVTRSESSHRISEEDDGVRCGLSCRGTTVMLSGRCKRDWWIFYT
jgi:hypothetical protein